MFVWGSAGPDVSLSSLHTRGGVPSTVAVLRVLSWVVLATVRVRLVSVLMPVDIHARVHIYRQGGVKYTNNVEAELEPLSQSKVAVQFKKFNLFGGLLSFNAPAR